MTVAKPPFSAMWPSVARRAAPSKPGPFDRGPLTLLQYLRVALHNGGFPGLHGNAAFEPLRRELVEGLETF